MTIKDCTNVIESKIKTYDSDYVLSVVEEVKTKIEEIQERRDIAKNSFFEKILSIFSFFRLKF